MSDVASDVLAAPCTLLLLGVKRRVTRSSVTSRRGQAHLRMAQAGYSYTHIRLIRNVGISYPGKRQTRRQAKPKKTTTSGTNKMSASCGAFICVICGARREAPGPWRSRPPCGGAPHGSRCLRRCTRDAGERDPPRTARHTYVPPPEPISSSLRGSGVKWPVLVRREDEGLPPAVPRLLEACPRPLLSTGERRNAAPSCSSPPKRRTPGRRPPRCPPCSSSSASSRSRSHLRRRRRPRQSAMSATTV